MVSVRTAAACAAVLVGLAFGMPVMAQNATSPAATAPLKLNQFMKKSAKPAVPARKARLASPQAKTAAKPSANAAKTTAKTPVLAVAKTKHRASVARVAHRSRHPSESAPVQTTGVSPRETETAPAERIKVMSFNEINELDLAADNVQVVAQDQLNELDAAADAPSPAPAPALEQSKAGESADATLPPSSTESSWLQRILLALGGVLASAAAIRLWIG